jgi:trimeric autotransporter adhesin
MSISSYTTVTMLDSRPAPITISVPKSTDITNRIITFKDLYGSASNSTIILVTRSGDTFEDGTFSTIMSNAYQTVNLYAGLPGKWLNVGATGGGGGDSAGLTTVSNLLNSVSTHVTTISTNLNTVSNRLNGVSTNVTTISTNLNTVSNLLNSVSTHVTTISTNLNTVSNHLNALSTSLITISTNLNTVSNVLTGVSTTVAAGRFPAISTTTISTSLVRAGYISSPQGYISSLIVDSLAFSLSNSFIVMGDIITTSVSTIQTFTSSLTTNNLRVGTVSTLSYIAFSGLQQGYTQTVIAEQATGTGTQELLLFRGSTTTDRIRMQTTGPIVFEPGVSARVFPATGSNVTPAMIITTGSNVGIGVAAPGVALDVAGAGRFTVLSTQTISTNQINSSNICNAGWISNGGILSNITAGAFFQATSNTTTLGVAGIATFASNITQTAGTTTLTGFSVNTISTNQINSSNICNAGWFSNNGVLSNITAGAFFQATSNTTTLGVAGIATFASNITQTAGTTTLTGFSVNTISTNQINSSNICNAGWFSNNGILSNTTAGAFFQATSNTTTLGVAGIATFASNITQTAGTTVLAGLSTNIISTGTLTVGGSALSPRLVIQSNATLTDPASVIITIPNTSYFYADYTNLTNYITISNYGAQEGDYINIVNTGNSGAPATFQVLDGSSGASTIIRYIYPGVAGVVAYSSSQWWPL